ncbi:MAG TPA: hypothetical protein VF801_05305 [Rhodocyclaceae bacterium]
MMCPKLADSEIASMKALMGGVLNAVIMEVFKLGPGDIRPELALLGDLHMDAAQRSRLRQLVAEYFDGASLEIAAGTTIADVRAQVVEN